MQFAGSDATKGFNDVHSEDILKNFASEYYLGDLDP